MDFKKNPGTDFKDIGDLSKKEVRKEAEARRGQGKGESKPSIRRSSNG